VPSPATSSSVRASRRRSRSSALTRLPQSSADRATVIQAQRAGPDRDAVAILELVFEARFAVDEDFICAATELAVDYGAVDDREGPLL